MKKLILTIMILVQPLISSANTLPAGEDTKEIMIGVTGMFVALKSGDLVVTKITPNTPVSGSLKEGDVLLSVNGESLKVQDPRPSLGFAINAAEGGDGKMKFLIQRGGKEQSVTIQLERIGSYSKTYPINCKKSDKIVQDTAKFILSNGGPQDGIPGNLEALFLLSTGDEKYMPAVIDYAHSFVGKGAGTSVWAIGYSGVFLGEYYLATGDKSVLPALKARCDALSSGQYYGGWGHDTDLCNPGYVTGGTLNAAGDQALTTLVLARECGVEVDEKTYNNALRQFFRFAGRGGVPYGDHHPELWWGSNGKNGGLAAALTLLPGKKFQGGAKLLALSETNSYWRCEGGHGSCFGNQTWRNIVDALVIDDHPREWRRHKDKMIWYFELSRMPGGGFRTPWFPGHGTIGKKNSYQTGLVAMAYTAHLKNLRICGKARTKFSVPHKPTAVEASLEASDFQRTDNIEGAVITEEPHEIAAVFKNIYDSDGKLIGQARRAEEPSPRKKQMPAEWYARMMRHYSPVVRVYAAHGLGYLGSEGIPEIKKALASKDGRLRTTGFDAISCSRGWSLGKFDTNITPSMVKEHFLPQIQNALKNPKASMWEKRHALMALSCADPESIKNSLELVKPFLHDDEWWLRVAAFSVMHPLVNDTKAIRGMLPEMMNAYHRETRLPARRWGAVSFFREAIPKNPDVKDEIIAGMAKSLAETPVREGFKAPIDTNNIFEALRHVNMKKEPENVLPILPSIERVYPEFSPWMSLWTIDGAGWGNIGLAKAAELLGEEGRPLVECMKRMRPTLVEKPKNTKKEKPLQKALDRLDEAVEAWEKKYGKVDEARGGAGTQRKTNSAADSKPRTFYNGDRTKSFVATLLKYDPKTGVITVRKKNSNKNISFPLSKLSREDQEYVRKKFKK